MIVLYIYINLLRKYWKWISEIYPPSSAVSNFRPLSGNLTTLICSTLVFSNKSVTLSTSFPSAIVWLWKEALNFRILSNVQCTCSANITCKFKESPAWQKERILNYNFMQYEVLPPQHNVSRWRVSRQTRPLSYTINLERHNNFSNPAPTDQLNSAPWPLDPLTHWAE